MNEPSFRKSAPLPVDNDDEHAWFLTWRELCVSAEQEGCTFVRMTLVNDEYPQGDLAHGCYLEGWLDQPSEQPPFVWPVDAA